MEKPGCVRMKYDQQGNLSAPNGKMVFSGWGGSTWFNSRKAKPPGSTVQLVGDMPSCTARPCTDGLPLASDRASNNCSSITFKDGWIFSRVFPGWVEFTPRVGGDLFFLGGGEHNENVGDVVFFFGGGRCGWRLR